MIGIMLMSYGSPKSLDDVGEFFSHILQGRVPSPEQVFQVREQYRSLGTCDPLGATTERQAEALQFLLKSQLSDEVRVYAAFKHAHPFIDDVVQKLVDEGASQIVTLPMNPLFSKMGVGSYQKSVREAVAKLGADLPVTDIYQWHTHPDFVSVIAKRVEKALNWLPEQTTVIFTAHNQRGKAENHPEYIQQFSELAQQVASELNLENWKTAYRSGGPNKDIWLSPYLADVIKQEASSGKKGIVTCDLLSLTGNSEVLHDIGLKCQKQVHELGLEYARTEFLNDSADFMLAMTNIVKEQLEKQVVSKV